MTQATPHAALEAPLAGQTVVVVRLGEVALKKGNRPFFVRRLARNIRRAMRGLDLRDLHWGPNRVLLTFAGGADWPEIAARLRRVFGVKNFSRCEAAPWDVDAIRERVLAMAARQTFQTFRITVQRSDKRFPLTSQELERDLGHAVRVASGARVDLTRPEANFQVEIMPGAAYLHAERIEGPGGLPLGVSGRVVALLSGGIDSPVAAWRTMSRGCEVTFVHFQSFPYLDASSRDKAIALVRALTPWQYRSRLHVVSFGDVQHQIVAACPPPLRVVLYRRFMLRIAEAIARRERAEALVTGESLGQVSSQTLSNIATIDHAATVPVLRPLVGRDKEEIIAEARKLGTYEISIEPDQDCCTLFVPRHPATHSSIADAEAAEAALDIGALVEQALATVETLEFAWPECEERGDRRPAADGGERESSTAALRTQGLPRPARHAVAAAVPREDGRWLAVRRPDEPEEELPGIWGLPAATLRAGESPEEALRRLGREKLGVELKPLRVLSEGEQARADYTLRMSVYEAAMSGEPQLPLSRDESAGTQYEALDWLPAASFNDAAARGSLCCRLFLEALAIQRTAGEARER